MKFTYILLPVVLLAFSSCASDPPPPPPKTVVKKVYVKPKPVYSDRAEDFRAVGPSN